jgi:FixJ family two-component response regulator
MFLRATSQGPFAVGADSNQFGVRLAFVLDDEARLGIALRNVLAGIGIEARQFVDPATFLSELETSNPDLILLDLALGQSDAIEVIHQLEDRNFKGRVILISGRDIETLLKVEQVGKAHGLSMLPSLPKPFRTADIRSCLEPSPALQPQQPEDEDGACRGPRPEARVPLHIKA